MLDKSARAQSYAFDAWNNATHASELIQLARRYIDEKDVKKALELLSEASLPARRIDGHIRSAIEYLEELQKGDKS